MDFVTLDFETATSKRNSPCEIALTFVNEGKIHETKSWLIKPKVVDFAYFNILIHGIRPEHVYDKPEFDQIWPEIRSLLENKFIICHNASFDMSVLRSTLELYKIPYPELNYSCSYIFSKKVWPGLPGYDLKTLCKLNSIQLDHHKAQSDSKATAELALKAFKISGVEKVTDIPVKLKTSIGKLFNGGYKPSETMRLHKPEDLAKIVGDPSKHNLESMFYARKVVFTGTLSSMSRSEAQKTIVDIGGFISNSVTRETDFLIVGHQDYRVVGEDGMSTKQEKAINLIEKGAPLEILSEAQFLSNI